MNKDKQEARLQLDFKEFTTLLPRLKNIEFLGLCANMGINFKAENQKEESQKEENQKEPHKESRKEPHKEPHKEFDILLEEVLDKFAAASRTQRKTWIKLLRQLPKK